MTITFLKKWFLKTQKCWHEQALHCRRLAATSCSASSVEERDSSNETPSQTVHRKDHIGNWKWASAMRMVDSGTQTVAAMVAEHVHLPCEEYDEREAELRCWPSRHFTANPSQETHFQKLARLVGLCKGWREASTQRRNTPSVKTHNTHKHKHKREHRRL